MVKAVALCVSLLCVETHGVKAAEGRTSHAGQATHLLLCVSVVCMFVCVCVVCLCYQVGYIPLSYDRDHEVELAQVAPDEQGRDTRLHVQVHTGAGPLVPPVLVVCACVPAAALPWSPRLLGRLCGVWRALFWTQWAQRASGGRAELTGVLLVCPSVCLSGCPSGCLFVCPRRATSTASVVLLLWRTASLTHASQLCSATTSGETLTAPTMRPGLA